MSSSKAKMLFNELERCRFTGSWSEVPEFARRYRKHEPKGIALQNLSLAEYHLYNLKPAYSNQHYINDNEANISLPPTVQSGQLRQVMEYINLSKSEPRLNDKDWSMQISVCEAKVHGLEGNYVQIPELLLNYNLTQLKSSVLAGTELLCTLWGLYLLGLSYEVDSNQYSEAIQYYLSAAEIMSKYRGDKSIEYFVIEENILYRLGYIQLSLDQLEDGISTMKIYSSSCSKWGEQFKPQKQINVLKKLTETFAKEPSLGSATTLQIPNMPDVTTNNSIESVDELIETQSRYEASIYQMIEYPKAGSENFQLLDMSDLFMNNWRKFNINSPKFTRQLLNSMHRVAKFTFQSPKVVRHIINLLYSLSEFDECKLALESYKNLIEKSIEVKATCIFDPIAKTEDEQTVPIPTNMEPLEAVVETYLLGIKFLINQFEDPKTALEYAEKSLILALPYNQLLTPLISRVYQYLGICHGQMTLRCQSKDERSYHHTSSLDAFKKSIEYNPDNWESCYFQALAHAQGREIESAVELVKKSLEIEPSFTQSWHLLVLLMSAQRQFEQALELCDVGIQESSSKLINLDNDSMVPETSVVDEEEIFNLKVTQNIIKETLYGHKEALSCQGQLFTLFTRIYGNIEQMPTEGMSSTTLLKSPSPVPRILAEEPNNSVRTTPRRRPSESHLTPNLPRSLSQSHLMSPETSSTLIKSPMYLLPRSTQSLPHLLHKRNRGIDTLVSLWLMSATMYCKLSKFKDAKLATEEAENCCPTSPDVWAKYGDIYLTQKQYDEALVSYQRGLVLQPNHVPSQLGLGKVYLELGKLDLAEASLNNVTNSGNGWYLPEAWYLLGKIYRETKRFKLAKEYLLYSMDLLASSPVRSFDVLWNLRCLA